MKPFLRHLWNAQSSGLILVTAALAIGLTFLAGTYSDRETGAPLNRFLNAHTLMQVATTTSFFAVMAVGMTMVIISGGIDLSVGSIYALCGVTTAMLLRELAPTSPFAAVSLGAILCIGLGALCGALNGAMVVGLRVHPFIITLGAMWVWRGVAFVASEAQSILMPDSLTRAAKATLGLQAGLHPVPLLVMLAVTLGGALYLGRTVMGRHIYAVGGNIEASRYSGLRVGKILIGVYVMSGLTAGIAAFVGSSYYGAAACADATGYELYVIASAVVGGASLSGGKGSAFNAMLGALLIVMIRQSITTLQINHNYEWIIIGCAIILAVVFDQLNARLAAKRLARGVEFKAV